MINTNTTPTHTHFLWTAFLVPLKKKKERQSFILTCHWENAFCLMRSSYTYSDTGFQTMLEDGNRGIFQHMNLISFFLKLGRETIFSTYTADVDPYVSFFSSVFGEFIIILFITRHTDRLIWLITSSGILNKTDRS